MTEFSFTFKKFIFRVVELRKGFKEENLFSRLWKI
jgi:hypothetical protein